MDLLIKQKLLSSKNKNWYLFIEMSLFISKTFSQQQVDWLLFWIIFIVKSWFHNFEILPQKTILPKIILGKRGGVDERWRNPGGMAKVTEDDGGRGGIWKPRSVDDAICKGSLNWLHNNSGVILSFWSFFPSL